MTKNEKEKLFKHMLWLEHKEDEEATYVETNYHEQASGAFAMLQVLGIASEYINWAIGK